VSSNKDNFLLKGALLFDLWFDVPLRPTRDIDLLGFGPAEEPLVLAAFEEMCQIECDDGIDFDIHTLKIEEIRKEASYSGLRISMIGYVDGARCPIQVDIGYGDAVTPAPELAEYPVMLSDTPVPILRVYPRYTVITEKFEALISLGMINTRLKDYFDLWVILTTTELDQKLLGEAITATFTRRKTPLPSSLPVGLSEEFSSDAKKVAQWNAFVKKNNLDAPNLDVVVAYLRDKLAYVLS
jgi:hypothetical protein